MNKTELIERIAEEAGVAEDEARKYFKAFEEVVTASLRAGEEIQITGFGKFYVREQKAWEGVNLQTGVATRYEKRVKNHGGMLTLAVVIL